MLIDGAILRWLEGGGSHGQKELTLAARELLTTHGEKRTVVTLRVSVAGWTGNRCAPAGS